MKRIICLFFSFCILIGIGIPVYADEFPQLVSEYVYILNLDNGKVVYEKAANEKMYPASMTKIMTTLIAIEQLEDITENILLEDDIFEGLLEAEASVVGYQSGDVASVKDLLYGIMLPSGADASRAIAKRVAGSEEAFVQQMNEKANALGLVNTNFVNTSGLHDDDHYSTAYEISIILQEALKNEHFKEIFQSTQYTTTPTSRYPNGIQMRSTRIAQLQMFGAKESFITGGKTGFTLEGGLCLASTAEVSGVQYMMISGNAGNEYVSAQHLKDALRAYEYLFETYDRKTLFQKGESMQEETVAYGKVDKVAIAAKEDIFAVVEKANPDIDTELILSTLQAPIEIGEEVGVITLTYKGEEISKTPIIAIEAVERDWMKFIGYWFMQILKLLGILIGILAIILILLLIRKYIRRYYIRKRARRIRLRHM